MVPERGVFNPEKVGDLAEPLAVENPHTGSAAFVRGNHQFRNPVPGQVANGHINPAGELGLERVDCEQLLLRDAVQNANVRRRPRSSPHNQIGDPITVEVARRRANAAREAGERFHGEAHGAVRVVMIHGRTAGVSPNGKLTVTN